MERKWLCLLVLHVHSNHMHVCVCGWVGQPGEQGLYFYLLVLLFLLLLLFSQEGNGLHILYIYSSIYIY